MCSRLLAVSLILPLVNNCYHGLVRVLYSSVDGSRLLIVALINGFHDGFRTVLLCRWKRMAHHTAPQMAADCSYLRSSTAFMTDSAPYFSTDGSGLLMPPCVNGFDDSSRTVLLSGGRRIAHSFSRQRLTRRFARCIALRMAADYSFFHSSTVFTTDCAPYCTADGTADRSFFLSSMAFTTGCAPYCSVDGSGLLIPLLINGFPDGSRTVLLSTWRRIAHSFSRQRVSRQFARHIAQRMAAHCSFFHSSTAFPMVRAPYCSVHGSAFLILPLVNGFYDGSCSVLLSGWKRIAHSSTR